MGKVTHICFPKQGMITCKSRYLYMNIKIQNLDYKAFLSNIKSQTQFNMTR